MNYTGQKKVIPDVLSGIWCYNHVRDESIRGRPS